MEADDRIVKKQINKSFPALKERVKKLLRDAGYNDKYINILKFTKTLKEENPDLSAWSDEEILSRRARWTPPNTFPLDLKPVLHMGKRYLLNKETGHTFHRLDNGSQGEWAGISTRRPKFHLNNSVPNPYGNLLGLSSAPNRRTTLEAVRNMLLKERSRRNREKELSSIDFSKEAMERANIQRFADAGIEIEDETLQHLTPSQRNELFQLVSTKNKQNHNNAINSFLQNALKRKGGKRTFRKQKHRGSKTRKH